MRTGSSTLAVWFGGGLALVSALPAGATATLGGTVSVNAGSGTCFDSGQVPGNTLQDSFHLLRTTACSGGSASAELRGSAATASIGLLATSSGNGQGSSQAAAQVQFADQWQIAVPAGTPWGPISLPVALHLDGSVTGAAIFHPAFGRFIDYNLNVGEPFSLNVFSATGSITATGSFSQTFSGVVTWQYAGQPLRASVEMSLFVPGLLEGAVDFYNTASVSMSLPAGYAATTSSGLPLSFAPVPEPSRAALTAAGLLLLLAARRRMPGLPAA